MMLSDRKLLVFMAIFWNYFLGWLGWHVLADVQPDCDFSYYLQLNQQQVLKSPGYDQGIYYDSGRICRWQYSSPPGTVFNVVCNPIDIPEYTPQYPNQCQQDRLVVSLSGNPSLSDGRNYCGLQGFQVMTTSNALSIGLVTAAYSMGGYYRCEITPIAGGGPPPTPTTQKPTTTTTKKPDCNCGWKQQRRIVGGQETNVNEYAFMAGLVQIEKEIVWCGAAIISNRYAVTAAHCVVQQQLTAFGLLVGDHNIAQDYETYSAQLYRLKRFIVHENYNNQTKQNDIALVYTTNPIAISLNVGPICLPYRYTNLDFTGAPVTAMGWGSTQFTGPRSDALRAVNLTVVSQSYCQGKYSNETIYNSEVCTYEYGKDACTFDSGGPVVWYDDTNTNRYQLLGIISFGRACATSAPGVNTRVPSYVSWILNQTPDAAYCFL